MVPRNPKGTGTTCRASGSGKYAQTKRLQNKVLAERNQAVAPVGVWVESVQEYYKDEHPNVRAMLTEELQVVIQREKEDSLRRFQDNVRHRVAQHAEVLKSRQLQKSYEMAERERRVLQQSSNAAQRLTPRKNVFPSSLQGEHSIRFNSHRIQAKAHKSSYEEGNNTDQQMVAKPNFAQVEVDHCLIGHNFLSKVMKQVRHRLADCQTVREAEVTSELPGGRWKVSLMDEPLPRGSRVGKEEEEDGGDDDDDEEADIPLIGQHDFPLRQFGPDECHGTKTVTFDHNPVCDVPLSYPYTTGHGVGISTGYRANQVIWPKEDLEELKRQRQSQFLTYRRLFMDIEREQVKERQRHRKHLRRIARIKTEKEQKRSEEEREMERLQQQEEERLETARRECLILERLQLEDEERADVLENKARARKDKEASRYIEALRAQMKEKMAIEKTEFPPLCCCGDSFWDSHPDTCANNCVFYSNHKAYAQALQSALLSCDLRGGNHYSHQRESARRIASIHALSPRK